MNKSSRQDQALLNCPRPARATKIFVASIPQGVSKEALLAYFSGFGPVEKVSMSAQSGRPELHKGYCTLYLRNRQVAQAIIQQQLHEVTPGGVVVCKPFMQGAQLAEETQATDMRRLVFKNLPVSMTDEKLKEYIEARFGSVEFVQLYKQDKYKSAGQKKIAKEDANSLNLEQDPQTRKIVHFSPGTFNPPKEPPGQPSNEVQGVSSEPCKKILRPKEKVFRTASVCFWDPSTADRLLAHQLENPIEIEGRIISVHRFLYGFNKNNKKSNSSQSLKHSGPHSLSSLNQNQNHQKLLSDNKSPQSSSIQYSGESFPHIPEEKACTASGPAHKRGGRRGTDKSDSLFLPPASHQLESQYITKSHPASGARFASHEGQSSYLLSSGLNVPYPGSTRIAQNIVSQKVGPSFGENKNQRSLKKSQNAVLSSNKLMNRIDEVKKNHFFTNIRFRVSKAPTNGVQQFSQPSGVISTRAELSRSSNTLGKIIRQHPLGASAKTQYVCYAPQENLVSIQELSFISQNDQNTISRSKGIRSQKFSNQRIQAPPAENANKAPHF